MKKGDIVKVKFNKLSKLNTAESQLVSNSNDILTREPKIYVKNAIPSYEGLVQISKKRGKKVEGRLIEYTNMETLPNDRCKYAERCGGCTFNIISPEKEHEIKEEYLKELFEGFKFRGLIECESNRCYRNKMEYSFGNSEKNGELNLGLHERNKFYNILSTEGCILVPQDFETVRSALEEYFRNTGADFYHKNTHSGFLRYCVIRQGEKSGEILINLVTSSEGKLNEENFVKMLKELDLKGEITGIIWTLSDNVADTVSAESAKVLYGTEVFTDRILDKEFLITPYSFFQVNTTGADELFSIVRSYAESIIKEDNKPVIYDLYSGTGAIGLLLSDLAREVYAIELNAEAAAIAEDNAKRNNVDNITFYSGDVLNIADSIETKPDLVILDPPRSGIHPKAIKRIIDLNPRYFIYISCNPVELRNDLDYFVSHGYQVDDMVSVNLFPMTTNVETVCLLSRENL